MPRNPKKKKTLADEKLEVVVGGNFVEIWHKDQATKNDYAGFEEGCVCEMKLARSHTNTLPKAIAAVLPRARAMALAPRMLKFIHELLVEWRAYNGEEETDENGAMKWAFDEAKAIINEIERGR